MVLALVFPGIIAIALFAPLRLSDCITFPYLIVDFRDALVVEYQNPVLPKGIKVLLL